MDKIVYNMMTLATLCLAIGSYTLLKQDRLVIIGVLCAASMQFLKIKCGK